MTGREPAARLRWLPNALTLARLAALPLAIACLRRGRPGAAAAVFLAAMLTDVADGWLARRLRAQTALGLYLDPAVDKIVILGFLYELAAAGRWPMAAAHLFLARELLQGGLRAAGAVRGEAIGANRMGKTKALLQSALITAGLLPGVPAAPLRAAAWAVLALAWWFFGVFAFRHRGVLRA